MFYRIAGGVAFILFAFILINPSIILVPQQSLYVVAGIFSLIAGIALLAAK